MIVKVCGNAKNISEVALLKPDLMGFIFYDKSPRHACGVNPDEIISLASDIKRVGVFVNASEEYILSTCQRYGLHAVQLHGSESPDFCLRLKDRGFGVYKAIGILDKEDMEAVKRYDGSADMIVLDTKTERHGGSGVKFDWSLLDQYPLKIPYLLSGGISHEDADFLSASIYPWMAGVDINSRFEVSPGFKDISLLTSFINKIRTR